LSTRFLTAASESPTFFPIAAFATRASSLSIWIIFPSTASIQTTEIAYYVRNSQRNYFNPCHDPPVNAGHPRPDPEDSERTRGLTATGPGRAGTRTERWITPTQILLIRKYAYRY